MPHDTREMRTESTQMFMSWGTPSDGREGFLDDAALWLTGGASLLLWTALSLLLTSA